MTNTVNKDLSYNEFAEQNLYVAKIKRGGIYFIIPILFLCSILNLSNSIFISCLFILPICYFTNVALRTFPRIENKFWGYLQGQAILSKRMWLKLEEEGKKTRLEQEERKRLIKKVGGENINNYQNQVLWIGADEEVVLEFLGSPEAITAKVQTASKNSETWQYFQEGKRYKLTIRLTNGKVVLIDDKR